MEKCISKFNK